MRPSRIRSSLILACASLIGVAGAPAAADPAAKGPKIDAFDRFDEEESPLQKGMLAARDKKWRKNLKLGEDSRCPRLVRAFATDKDKIIERLCGDADRTECLQEVCGDPDYLCAEALIEGDDPTGVCQASSLDKPPELGCADSIFRDDGKGRKALECLEDPYDSSCDPADPSCAPELRAACKKVFADCDDMPFMRKAAKKAARSGEITDATGRKIGKRVQTTTVFQYDKVEQKKSLKSDAVVDGWDPIGIRASRTDTQLGAPGGPLPPTVASEARLAERRQLGAGAFHAECEPLELCSENDDGDCFDMVTGQHFDETECFAGTVLNTTLEKEPCPTEFGHFDVCCRHVGVGAIEGTDEMLFGDDCLADPTSADCEPDPYDPNCAVRTTLVQLIDEDPADDRLNNDGDCTDGAGRVTSLCLDANGALHTDHTWAVDEDDCGDDINQDGDCQGAGGEIGRFEGGRCLRPDDTVIGETEGEDFVQLIDEDCADEVDNDDDGQQGEDPPGVLTFAFVDSLAREETACRDFYAAVDPGLTPKSDELPDATRGCDVTRAMRVHVNQKMKDDPDKYDKFTKKTGRDKFFDVDDDGEWCDDAASSPNCPTDPKEAGKRGVVHKDKAHEPRESKGKRSYKYEERKVTVDEVFGVKCRPVKDEETKEWVGTHYDEESGNCVRDDAEALFMAALASGDCATDECRQAMMGFTFAPPVLEWGWRTKFEVCIFGFCFEIFYARIGYEFDLAAGIRLPVEIQFDDVPDSVLATQDIAVETGLQPLDFSVDDYRAFCEQHDLDAPWYIANCDRFAFPDFLDSADGDEFVAHYSIFAGLIVRVFSIPLLNWAVDSSIDLPAMCTTWNLLNGVEGMSIEDIVRLELGLLEDGDVLQALKDNFGNCGSYTTPFAYEPCDVGEPGCPLVPPHRRLRAWPFLSGSYSIRADCFDAVRHGEVMTIKGKKRPICTGLILGTSGASLGVGLTVETNAGSLLITTDWSGAGDAEPVGPHELEYTRSTDDPEHTPVPISVRADNYVDDPLVDDAIVRLDDFTYYLNAIEIALSASLEFGGILSPIPDIGSFTLFSFAFSTGKFGIPIPQHPDTEPVELAVPVENYALALAVAPDVAEVEPGCALDPVEPDACPVFDLTVENRGSRTDDFDDFTYELSNHQRIGGCPDVFAIDPNNDHDCVVGGVRYHEDPFDGVADNCYDACGQPLDPTAEAIGEDPPGCADPGPDLECSVTESDEDGDGYVDEDGPDDAWAAAFDPDAPTVADVPAHTDVGGPDLLVSPLRHPTTSPGIYPYRLTADSVNAKGYGLPARDPSGNFRIDAPIVGTLEVVTFFDPIVAVVPAVGLALPGATVDYSLEFTNGANTDDSMDLAHRRLDFNEAGCDLVTLGRDPGCPYRAVPTILPEAWIRGAIPVHVPVDDPVALMAPLRYETAALAIDIPPDWQGMEDTVYQIEITATSTEDPAVPPAANTWVLEQTVEATLESRTRYIGLEIDALIAALERANAVGVRTKGLLPIATHPVRRSHERAMAELADGDEAGAAKVLGRTIKATEAFLHALEGSGGDGKIPEPWYTELHERASAILGDLERATALAAEPAS